jgi:hypothetical protein
VIVARPQQVAPALRALFDARAPASLRCFAVLAGLERGAILTDHLAHPTWGAVREAADGTLYVGGALDAPLLARLVALLRADGDVLAGFWPGDRLEARLPPAPEYVGDVLEFLGQRDDARRLDALVRRLPAGYALRPMDGGLAARSPSYDEGRFGSPQAYLAERRAVYVAQGEALVCEASTGPSIGGVRELGVWTHEAHRRRGLATAASAALAQLCLAAGEQTYWNCAASNEASAAIARSLGYCSERRYRLHAWGRRTG